MLEYRMTFFLNLLPQLMSYSAGILVLWIVVKQFKTIGTWGPDEILFLFAMNVFTYAIGAFFVSEGSKEFVRLLHSGDFDDILTKPFHSFFFLMFKNVHPGYIIHIIVASVVMSLSITNLGITMTFVKVLMLILAIAGGALIQGSSIIIMTVPGFWLIKTSVMDFFWDLRNFIRYPLSIYHKAIQVFLTVVVPFGFISFYPSQYFLGKNDFLMFHPVLQYLTPAVGVFLTFAAISFWNFGVSRYKSTGS